MRVMARQHRRLEPVVLPLVLDQVRDDLGVGLGHEPVALGDCSSRFSSR